jgi:hypothetical protein
MTNETRDNVCAHKGCSCPANDDSKYCSAACETAENNDTTAIACGCGHSGCKGEIAA